MKPKLKLRLRPMITILVCGVSILCLLVTNYFVQKNVENTVFDHIEEKAKIVSRTAAISPIFIEGLAGRGDEDIISQHAEKLRKLDNVAFLVVLDMNGVRKSHPIPGKIGKKYVGGDADHVFKGLEYSSIAVGTLGKSLRYFTPVYNQDGEQIGAILVGVLLDEIQHKVWESTRVIILSMVLGTFIGLIGAIFLSKKVKNILLGMEPDEVANLLEQRSAVLDYVREGVMAVDCSSRITLINQEAARLINTIDIKINPVGNLAEDVFPHFDFTTPLISGRKELDQEYSFRGLVVVANIVPIYVDGVITGAVATFRDKTEIKLLAEQLTGARILADSLRAQTHEFMNKLHVILGMVQMEFFDQLADYIKQISNSFQTEVGYITARVKDPVIAGFLLGKRSYARENDASLNLKSNSYLPKFENNETVQEILTIVGNLVDNSIDAIKDSREKTVEIELVYTDGELLIQVSDTGSGFNQEIQNHIFIRGYSTKGENRGIGLYLVQKSITKLNGKISVCSNEGAGTEIKIAIPFKEQEGSS